MTRFSCWLTGALATSVVVAASANPPSNKGASHRPTTFETVASFIDAGGLATRIEQGHSRPGGRRSAGNFQAAGFRFIGVVDGWRVHSTMSNGRLVVIQERSEPGAHPGSMVLRTTLTPPKTRMAASIGHSQLVPTWWPVLDQPWVRKATDRHGGSMTTLLGWFPGSVDRARTVFERAAHTAQMRLLSQASATPGRYQHPAGELLVFAGAGKELLLTLTPDGQRVGVVSHFKTNPEVIR